MRISIYIHMYARHFVFIGVLGAYALWPIRMHIYILPAMHNIVYKYIYTACLVSHPHTKMVYSEAENDRRNVLYEFVSLSRGNADCVLACACVVTPLERHASIFAASIGIKSRMCEAV